MFECQSFKLCLTGFPEGAKAISLVCSADYKICIQNWRSQNLKFSSENLEILLTYPLPLENDGFFSKLYVLIGRRKFAFSILYFVRTKFWETFSSLVVVFLQFSKFLNLSFTKFLNKKLLFLINQESFLICIYLFTLNLGWDLGWPHRPGRGHDELHSAHPLVRI